MDTKYTAITHLTSTVQEEDMPRDAAELVEGTLRRRRSSASQVTHSGHWVTGRCICNETELHFS